MRSAFFAMTALFLAVLPAQAATPQPSASPDFLLLPAYGFEAAPLAEGASPRPSTAAQVGDQVPLLIRGISLPEGSTIPLKLELPAGSPPLNEQGFEVLPPAANTSKPGSADLRTVIVLLKPGKLTLPSLMVQDSAGKAIARTQPWNIEVQSAIRSDDPEPQKPVDLRPPAELEFPWWVVVTAGFLGLLIFAALTFWAYRWSQRSRMKPARAPEPEKPEDEEALSAFLQLEKSGALASGDFKRHYFRVSEVLKKYIGRRYGFDAPESTTREMIQNLERLIGTAPGLDTSRLASLIELFDQLDRVKFTDHVPARSEGELVIPIAREFVLKTRKRPEPVVVPSTGGSVAPR